MEIHKHDQGANQNYESWFKRHRWISYVALVVIAYYLLTEHREHIISYLPYFIFASCLLMHVFMHGGHHHHNNRQKPTEENKS
ncbi:DUF2933 domain-containing protein [Bacteriovorax antarcticus]|jgi:hypothetical protein|uniref:DUF2933 domain-containing protein n=1 Tax=Bacteriovorax antarcticus TaxID=3088717 RepID=UPI00396B3040